MKYVPGRSAALPLMFIAIAARLFCEMALLYPAAHNAVWLCPIAGLLLYLPFAFALQRAAALGNDSAWGNLESRLPRFLSALILLILIALLLLDASAMMDVAAGTASFSIGDKAVITLELPLAVLLALMVLLGPDAAGNNARIGLYILGFLLVILALTQIPIYRPGWIAPILGGGAPSILNGALRCAGSMALLSLPWLFAVPDRARFGPTLWGSAACLLASVLLLFLQMLSPTFVGTELLRPARMEILLNNGRVAISLQFVYLIAWYGGLLHLLSAEAVTAACIIRRLLPGLKPWLVALLEAVGVFLLSGSERIQAFLAGNAVAWLFPLIGLLLLVSMAAAGLAKGGGRRCGQSSAS